MRLVVTSDTHFPVNVQKMIPDGDVFIHAGDLMRTGYPDEWARALAWLRKLPHKIKLFIPGNHDFHLKVYPGPALQDMRHIGVTVLGLPGNTNFQSFVLPNGKSVLGLPFVTDLERWAFNSTEEEIEKYLDQLDRHDIVVSHSPMRGVLDKDTSAHRGIQAYRDYAERVSPDLWFHGHVHEKFGQEIFGKTLVRNVAMCDENYKHKNKAIVVDI